jgi:hypothetical protein
MEELCCNLGLFFLHWIHVKSIRTYKLDRYKISFSDYKLASERFDEAVINISQNGPDIFETLKELSRILDIKHEHFLACAKRLLADEDNTSRDY